MTERNEQEGIKFLAIGLMQGIRNVYMHTRGTEKLYYCVQIITTTDLLLKQVLGWESVASSCKKDSAHTMVKLYSPDQEGD